MEIVNITANGTEAIIDYSDGSTTIGRLDSTCIQYMNDEQYQALVVLINNQPEIYFDVLKTIKYNEE